MGKPELGLKCTCVSCAVRFFDLCRTPAVCPKCGAEQPKAKQRAFAPSRAVPRRWSTTTAPLPGAAPPEAEAAEPSADDEAAEEGADVLDDADAVEPDAVDDDDVDVRAPSTHD